MNLRPVKTTNPGIIRRTLMKMPVIKRMFKSQSGNIISASAPHTPQMIAPIVTVNTINRIDLAGVLKKTVASLDYPDHVAQAFSDELMGWKDAVGKPLMHTWKETLDKARGEHKSGKLGLNELVNIESKIIAEIGNKISSEFKYNVEIIDLPMALKSRQAHCEIYTHMVYAIATGLGFPVQGAYVFKMFMPLPPEISHEVALVSTTDKRMILVDLAQESSIFISKPFNLETSFRKYNNDLELISGLAINDDIRNYIRIRVLDLNSLIAVKLSNIGHSHTKSGRFQQAIDFQDKAINLDPKFAAAYYSRANAYGYLNQHELAIADYTMAIYLDPEYFAAYNNRGRTYSDMGDHEQQAITDLKKAISLNSKYALTYMNLGLAYGKLRQHEQAIATFDKAIALDPTNGKYYYNRGVAFFNRGQHNKAIGDYDKAIQCNPKDSEAYFNRGIACINIGITHKNLGYIKKGASDLRAAGQFNSALKMDIEEIISDLKSKGLLNRHA